MSEQEQEVPTPSPEGTPPEEINVEPEQLVTPPPEPTAEPVVPVERVVPAADGYTMPDGMPPEMGVFANEHGFTQGQLDATLKQFGDVVTASKQNEFNAMKKAGEDFVETWGDRKDFNLSLARRALKQNDPDGTLKTALDESGYGNHPAVLGFLHKLGVSMQEGGYLKSAVNRPPGQKTVAQTMYGDSHPSTE